MEKRVTQFLAGMGRNVSQNVAFGKAASKLPGPVRRHPYITAGIGMMTAGGIASGRQRSGLDKVRGRPTGIYGY